MISGSSRSAAPAACLSLVIGIAFAAGAAPGAPPPGQPAHRDLARGLPMLQLWGASDRYVYFSPMSGADDGVVTHMRAPKAGGPAQPIAGLPASSLSLDGIEVHGARIFMLLNRDAAIGLSHDIVSLDETGGSRTVIARDRPEILRGIVLRDHACWIESAADKRKQDPQRLTIFCADLGGHAVRPVWHGPDSISNAAALGDDLLLFQSAPTVNITTHDRYESVIAPGTESSILRISPAGGAPKTVWKQASLLSSGAVDGNDVYACTDAGLIRISAADGKSTVFGSSCEGPLTVWHGWRFQSERAVEPRPIRFGRVEAGGQMHVLFPKTLGMGVVTDDQAVYACAVSDDPTVCDLRRIDAAELAARSKKGAK